MHQWILGFETDLVHPKQDDVAFSVLKLSTKFQRRHEVPKNDMGHPWKSPLFDLSWSKGGSALLKWSISIPRPNAMWDGKIRMKYILPLAFEFHFPNQVFLDFFSLASVKVKGPLVSLLAAILNGEKSLEWKQNKKQGNEREEHRKKEWGSW